MDAWYDFILKHRYQRILHSSSTNSTLDDTHVHDIILFQRETLYLDDMKNKKKIDEFQNQEKYKAYLKYIEYAMNIWEVMKSLKSNISRVNFSENTLIDAFKGSLEFFPTNEIGNIHITEYTSCIGLMLNKY
jgi:hypothetical protein